MPGAASPPAKDIAAACGGRQTRTRGPPWACTGEQNLPEGCVARCRCPHDRGKGQKQAEVPPGRSADPRALMAHGAGVSPLRLLPQHPRVTQNLHVCRSRVTVGCTDPTALRSHGTAPQGRCRCQVHRPRGADGLLPPGCPVEGWTTPGRQALGLHLSRKPHPAPDPREARALEFVSWTQTSPAAVAPGHPFSAACVPATQHFASSAPPLSRAGRWAGAAVPRPSTNPMPEPHPQLSFRTAAAGEKRRPRKPESGPTNFLEMKTAPGTQKGPLKRPHRWMTSSKRGRSRCVRRAPAFTVPVDAFDTCHCPANADVCWHRAEDTDGCRP